MTRGNPPLRRTALALGALFIADLWFAGQGMISLLVAGAGTILLVPAAIGALIRGRRPVARNRVAHAAVYFLLGAATLGTLRLHAFTARTHASQIIEACRDYEVKHGRLPNRLEELVPDFLPAVPHAKYVLAWGEFNYWASSPTSHTLMYTAVAPFGRRLYSLEQGRWSEID